MDTKTETKKETMNRLFKENGLLDEDIHKHAHYTIINRMGIEKIQYKNGVIVTFSPVVMERDFCVVKATATRDGVPPVETFGSASKETSQNKYYPEMAEKRALSRAVLKICNFYQLGVYGEDEADDFKASKSEPVSKKQSDKIDQAVAESAPVMAATPLPADGEKPVSIEQKTKILLLLNNSGITPEKKQSTIDALNNGFYNGHTIEAAIAKIQAIVDKYEASKTQTAA